MHYSLENQGEEKKGDEYLESSLLLFNIFGFALPTTP